MLLRPLFLLLALLLANTAAAAASSERTFDVPAGVAEQRLLELSEQAGVQILFPANAVEGIRTNAVQG
jgi:iron complex outermembrane receptor protein